MTEQYKPKMEKVKSTMEVLLAEDDGRVLLVKINGETQAPRRGFQDDITNIVTVLRGMEHASSKRSDYRFWFVFIAVQLLGQIVFGDGVVLTAILAALLMPFAYLAHKWSERHAQRSKMFAPAVTMHMLRVWSQGVYVGVRRYGSNQEFFKQLDDRG